jgi:hypothetical protein
MPLKPKPVTAVIESGGVSIVDADDATKKAAVSDEAPSDEAYAEAVRIVGGEEAAKLSNKLQFLQLVELVRIRQLLTLR